MEAQGSLRGKSFNCTESSALAALKWVSSTVKDETGCRKCVASGCTQIDSDPASICREIANVKPSVPAKFKIIIIIKLKNVTIIIIIGS